MTNLSLTEKEIIFLQKMKSSDFYEDGIDSILWDYSVNDHLPFSGKTRSGVVSSLSQKNILWVTKKERGDIAGTYSLSPEAKQNNEIKTIFND